TQKLLRRCRTRNPLSARPPHYIPSPPKTGAPPRRPPHRTPWLWTLTLGHHEDRSPTHGYEPTREAAMANVPSFYKANSGASTSREGWRRVSIFPASNKPA